MSDSKRLAWVVSWRARGGAEIRAGLTSSSGVDAGDLAQRRSHAEDDEGHADPAPDDVARPAANQRIVEGGGQAVGNRGQHEGHEGHLHGRAVARQFRGIAHSLQHGVGRPDLLLRKRRRIRALAREADLAVEAVGVGIAGGGVVERGHGDGGDLDRRTDGQQSTRPGV